jgi:WD40 repeat protein
MHKFNAGMHVLTHIYTQAVTPVHVLEGHIQSIFCVAISDDSKLIASCCGEHCIKIWCTDTGLCLYTLVGPSDDVCSLDFSRDGTMLASGCHGHEEHMIKVWALGSGQTPHVIHNLTGHTDLVWSVKFSNDCTKLASGCIEGMVKIWDVQSG